jgi:lysophospholipase L1-like esterase
VGGRLRRIGFRGVAVAIGLVAGLLVLEVVLQTAALVVAPLLARTAGAGPVAADDRVRVVCVGDSHVYGAMVAPAEAFPEQLDGILRRHGIRAQVVNLGLPGQNSRQVLDRLPTALARYRPRLVVVWIGINNYWNMADRSEELRRRGIRDRLFNASRVLRLVRLLLKPYEGVSASPLRPQADVIDYTRGGETHWTQDGEEVVMRRGRLELDPETTIRLTTEDLTAIVERVRAAGADVVLMQYPFAVSENVRAVNAAVSRAGTQSGALVVDTRFDVQALGRRGVSGLNFPDMHPTPVTYRAIAWNLARRLERRRLLSVAPR